MIKSFSNPWENMKFGTRRRIEFETNHDYFWIVNFEHQYGFYIKLQIEHLNFELDVKLKGIDIFTNTTDNNNIELCLTLDRNEDWEIFYVLCKDLITTIDKYKLDKDKLVKLKNRLKKWKNLLANKGKLSLSTEKQMGLFSELYCLKNIIARYKGYNVAIDSWVGVNQDRQDFNLEKIVLEVKSHRVTKGNVANISSIDQLYTEKDQLYLVSYGVTIADTGQTIDDIYNDIVDKVDEEYVEKLKLKLFEAGWIPNFTEQSKDNFVVDSETIYYVNELFPRLNRELIDNRINEIKYKIDLSRCREFVRTLDEVFGGE
ncbi:hypothetical protein AN1V17_06600 [Vallitalea sediminicola]